MYQKIINVFTLILVLFIGFASYNNWWKNPVTTPNIGQFSIAAEKTVLNEKAVMSIRDSLISLREAIIADRKNISKLEMALKAEIGKQIGLKLAELSQKQTIKTDFQKQEQEKIAELQQRINVLNKVIYATEKLARIQNNIRELQMIKYYAPTDKEIYQLLLNEYQLALNSNDWSRLEPTLNNLALFLQKNPEFTDLNKHNFDPQLKVLLEKKGIKFNFKFTDETEYFGYLLQIFEKDENQIRMGHYADIMAGLYQKPAIQAKYGQKLKQIVCPGNGRPLYEYLKKRFTTGNAMPIPPDIKF